MGGDLILLICHFGFWSLFLILIESGMLSCCKRNKLDDHIEEGEEPNERDNDVVEEENRVANTHNMNVRVH